ncbi:calcium/proton exchanger [Vararia minispora EC-137]|uniref:Calcium/proton exchanger n=1 Tax=Vararia minispora EC-137 TaxID=1314806 RepID=A0ACB8QB96_9AGAM|nr:calcium/proton exchanger [Vararia minispora EC-137]
MHQFFRVHFWKDWYEQHKSKKPIGKPPSLARQLYSVLFTSWLNLLLVFIPISWAFHFAGLDNTLVFVFCFLAIIPLASLLAFATEELSLRLGQTLAGLLNATLGNAVELIVAIIALVKCQLQVVQASLVGSILSNLLLVLGMCFFAGGTRFSEQGFGLSATQLNSSLLTLSVIGVLLPAAFHLVVNNTPSNPNGLSDSAEARDILAISHGVAIILLFIYICYLVFQLFSHKELYDDSALPASKKYDPALRDRFSRKAKPVDEKSAIGSSTALAPSGSANGHANVEAASTAEHVPNSQPDTEAGAHEEDDEKHEPTMSVVFTAILLTTVTVLVAITADFLVDSINGLTESGSISKEFVGLILLPIVGNAAEHVTAVTVSVKDKLTLSLGVAVGSSIQIALFVIPFIVTLGWILGKPLTMLFDPFESIVLFLSVLTVNYVVQDGRSNWLEGMILMCLYVICAVVFWFYPGSTDLTLQCT